MHGYPYLYYNYFIGTEYTLSKNQGRQTGGGLGGVSTPPEFWMEGLNTCQPPLILRKKFLTGVGSP